MIKVYLGGEGANELGTRGQRPPGNDPGVIETLLRRVRPDGWRVEGAIVWKAIRKYQAGAAAHYPTHGETYNVLRLLLLAYEQDCEMVVFVRDVDGDDGRQDVAIQPLQSPAARRFAHERGYQLAAVGCMATPNLEGWILCLLGRNGTDDLSPKRAQRDLEAAGVPAKSTHHFVEIARTRPLPANACSLDRWLSAARAAFQQLIDGTSHDT